MLAVPSLVRRDQVPFRDGFGLMLQQYANSYANDVYTSLAYILASWSLSSQRSSLDNCES
jgi:hypothetical protein